VVTENGDGACLVILRAMHDLAQAALDMLQEAKSGLSPLPGTVRQQGVRLVDAALVVTRCQSSRSACANSSLARVWRGSSDTRCAKNPPLSTKTCLTAHQRTRPASACTSPWRHR
jgi:hypothetical protein